MRFSVRGFTAATGTTNPKPVAQLWNADGAQRIRLIEVAVYEAGTIINPSNRLDLRRSSARGTAGSTVTPDADNCWEADDVPASGALLDLAQFSVDPTYLAPEFWAMNPCGGVSTGTAGTGMAWWDERGIWIPPGSGVVVVAQQSGANAWPTSEVYFVWEDG